MTDAQRRLLFRILAEQGFEEDLAHERLLEYAKVESLGDITKRQASGLIDEMKREDTRGS